MHKWYPKIEHVVKEIELRYVSYKARLQQTLRTSAQLMKHILRVQLAVDTATPPDRGEAMLL